MESSNSSTNHSKGHSPREASDCDEMTSVTSSTCESSVDGPYSREPDNIERIKHRTSRNKSRKTMGEAKSRLVRIPLVIPYTKSSFDSPDSSPHYLKATSSSQGKKMASLSHSNKSLQTLSRSSSLRNVRILLKKASFKPKRGLLRYSKLSDDMAVTRATHSSTIKRSKFPETVEARLIGVELEESSPIKVCRYQHCSLHGHCHGTHEPVARTKSFLSKRRKSFRKQKSMLPKTEMRKILSDKKRNTRKIQMIPTMESLNRDEDSFGSYEEIGNNQPKELHGFENIQGLDIAEVAFGEMSFPERSYQENLEICRKYSSLEWRLGWTLCSNCSCHIQEQITSNLGRAGGNLSSKEVISFRSDKIEGDVSDNGSLDANAVKKSNEEVGNFVEDSAFVVHESDKDNKDGPETPVAFEKSNKMNIELSLLSSFTQASSDAISEDEWEFKARPMPASDSKRNNDKAAKQRHISMWHLIHQHMAENLAVGSTDEQLEGESSMDGENSVVGSDLQMGTVDNQDSENREIELRKVFAIKVVREAIEKILLPEVQDQTSDDQSVTSETTPRIELSKQDQTLDTTEQNQTNSDATVSTNTKQEIASSDNVSSRPEIEMEEKKATRNSEKKAPKHWSNLKKWILLQKFIRELEKVKKFNPKKPQLSPLSVGPETEKFNLRRQTGGGRKNAEEWMLDYALRQAVGQLAPTQKKKVAVLVKAFETVAPINEEAPQVQYRIPRLESEEIVFEGDEKNLRENENSANHQSDITMFMETKMPEPLNDTRGGESRDQRVAEENQEVLDGDLMSSIGNTNINIRDCDSGKVMAVKLERLTEDKTAKEGGHSMQMEKKNRIKMWHMIYQHVASGIAEKVGTRILNGADVNESDDTISPNNGHSIVKNHETSGFTISDALKLVKEAVDEILSLDIQDDSSDTQSISDIDGMSEINNREIGGKEGEKAEVPRAKNWSKLKKLIMVKRSIKALESDRRIKPATKERQMMEEMNKAKQWMLDYAVQHIVTKLTPDRKRRVSLLVEAFEAVVPLPEM